MSRNTTTTTVAPVTTDADDTTATAVTTDADTATDTPDTDADRAITTADAYAATDPSDPVADYVAGVVTRPAAVAYANRRMADAVTAGTNAAVAGDMTAVAAAMTDAGRWSGVVTALGSATRRPVRTGPDADAYAVGIVARMVALRDAARALGTGAVIPSDVPTDMADAVRAAVVRIMGDRSGRVTDDTTAAHAIAYAGRPVVSNGGTPLDPHLASLWAVTATDAVVTFAAAARHRSDAWPTGIPNGSGRIGARFVGTGGTPLPARRWPTGWAYAETTDGRRGMRRLAPGVTATDA
jgi:hypothetical protein